MEVCGREGAFLKKVPLPRALSRKDYVGGGEILGGEAASLREAPLPPDPSLPKSGWRLGCAFSADLVPPEGGGGLRCINIRNGRKMRLL